MFGWLRRTSPFVKHIVKSLDENPDQWELVEEKKQKSQYRVPKGTPGAVRSFEEWYVWSDHMLKLRHRGTSEEIIIADDIPESPEGWYILSPRWTIENDKDKDVLSKAVLRWRQQRMKKLLDLNEKEQQLLHEAMQEVESELEP